MPEAGHSMVTWKDALSGMRIRAWGTDWVEGNWSLQCRTPAIEKLFEQYPAMDSVFVASDQMAVGLFLAAFRRIMKTLDDIGNVYTDFGCMANLLLL